MQNGFGQNSRDKRKVLFKRRIRIDDIIWLDLEGGCWKAGNALNCFSINKIGGRCKHGNKIYVQRNMDTCELLKENTATHGWILEKAGGRNETN